MSTFACLPRPTSHTKLTPYGLDTSVFLLLLFLIAHTHNARTKSETRTIIILFSTHFRIVYASRPNPPHNKREDTTLEYIEKHLKQLQPIFEKYKNDIYAFQAGIIGHYGEWHNSVYGLTTDENKVKVIDLLHKYLPTSPCLKVQVRTPMDAVLLAPHPPKNDQEAFGDKSTCTRSTRIGFHNDCWMSGADDYSTYVPPPSSGISRGTAAREYWLNSAFLGRITRYSGFGGETCVTADGGKVWSGLSCTSLFAEATKLHSAFINPSWHPKVTAFLKDSCCWGPFLDRLGYRFEVTYLTRSLTHSLTLLTFTQSLLR